MLLAGIDEAGRGPLVGPVYAAAVILSEAKIADLKDSKQLTEARRESLFDEICQSAICYSIAYASAREIEKFNILQATLIAMQRAIEGLSVKPDEIIVDGKHTPKTDFNCRALVKGDQLVPAISAAAILAKVSRDREMRKLDLEFPQYGFAVHKGYPTKQHLAAIREFGIIDQHRRTFSPIKYECING